MPRFEVTVVLTISSESREEARAEAISILVGALPPGDVEILSCAPQESEQEDWT